MNSFALDEGKFWQLSPAAAEIFEYLRENAEASSSPFGFDRGSVSADRRATHASFSCVAASGWGNDELTISANLTDDGSWQLNHSIKRVI